MVFRWLKEDGFRNWVCQWAAGGGSRRPAAPPRHPFGCNPLYFMVHLGLRANRVDLCILFPSNSQRSEIVDLHRVVQYSCTSCNIYMIVLSASRQAILCTAPPPPPPPPHTHGRYAIIHEEQQTVQWTCARSAHWHPAATTIGVSICTCTTRASTHYVTPAHAHSPTPPA